MNSFQKLIEAVNTIRKDSDYSIFENIPDEFLKDKKEINKMTSQIYKQINPKTTETCLYPGCKNNPIKSHSLQKSLLKSIADKSNHVLRIQIIPNFRPGGKIETLIKPIGINEASTFEGYCNEHDTEIFLPIEQNIIDYKKDQHNFLLLLRSVAREFFESRKSYNMMGSIVSDMIKDLKEDDLMGPLLISQLYLSYLEYFHIEKIKDYLDLYYRKIITEEIFEFGYLKINKKYPIFLNTFFALQGSNDTFTISKDITQEMPVFFSITMIPSDGETHIYYSYMKEQKDELRKYIEKFNTQDLKKTELFLTDTILRNSDNFYIQPEYWKNIPESEKNDILELFFKTTNNREYVNSKSLNMLQY